jgi:hypothetical protein
MVAVPVPLTCFWTTEYAERACNVNDSEPSAMLPVKSNEARPGSRLLKCIDIEEPFGVNGIPAPAMPRAGTSRTLHVDDGVIWKLYMGSI